MPQFGLYCCNLFARFFFIRFPYTASIRQSHIKIMQFAVPCRNFALRINQYRCIIGTFSFRIHLTDAAPVNPDAMFFRFLHKEFRCRPRNHLCEFRLLTENIHHFRKRNQFCTFFSSFIYIICYLRPVRSFIILGIHLHHSNHIFSHETPSISALINPVHRFIHSFSPAAAILFANLCLHLRNKLLLYMPALCNFLFTVPVTHSQPRQISHA